MKVRINEIAKIQTGVYAKPALEDAVVYYIQNRHFNENRVFDLNTKPELVLNNNLDNHYLEVGDILVAAKGNNFYAVVYKGRVKPAVASSSFLVVKIFEKEIYNPEFVAWQINHPINQKKLQEGAKGTSIPSITKTEIGDIELQIIHPAKQHNIVQIDSLLAKKKQLQQQLSTLNESLINNQLYKIISINEQ